MVERYIPDSALETASNGSQGAAPWRFQPGRPKTGGRTKGTPNKVPSNLLSAIIEACALVGYDRDVYRRERRDGKWVDVVDETKRIEGLVPYIRRTVELHRKETLAILGKIVTPAVVQLVMNMQGEGEGGVEVQATVEDLEREVASMGISVSMFHGDPGRTPKVINHEE